MLEKITHRKHKKVIEEIEKLIKYEEGRRDYYEQDLRAGLKRYDAEATIRMIKYHENRIGALYDALRTVKYYI